MSFSRVYVFVAGALCLTVIRAIAAPPPPYKATILNPVGYASSTANGVSGASQVGTGTGSLSRALLWNGTPASVVNLHPAGFEESSAFGISGSTQVGIGRPTADFNDHALLWHGTAASVVDLNPAGFNQSFAEAVSDETQVGYGWGPATGGQTHALLWNGTAASAVDLQPSGFSSSMAGGVSGTHQGGSGNGPTTNYYNHALLWNGTAASAVDLHPSGFDESGVGGVSGGTQVGSGYGLTTGGEFHALLWNGTAASAVDLNPAGFISSESFGVAGDIQVGRGYGPATNGKTHALLWNGTAASAVDLHAFLTGLGHSFTYSQANGVDANGNVVGYAFDANGQYAILWTLVPEPSTATLFICGLIGASTLHRRRRNMPRYSSGRHIAVRVAICLLGPSWCPIVVSALTIPTVPVDNPGNPSDQNYSGQGQFGAVPYRYRIAVHEVTNEEYAVFLTDKAGGSGFERDPYQLYHPYMDADPRGGISYVACTLFTCGPNGTGQPDYTIYFAKPNMGNKPVNYVSWVDAIRYVNYLNNGPGLFSSTETGAYTVGEKDSGNYPLHPEAITRNPGATWILPTENEWYKAAYYQPAAEGGDSDGYWLSPTRSNVTAAVLATANSVGNISNPGPNVMNEGGTSWNGQPDNVTTVGSAGALAASYYGTYDQGGNVVEWTESSAAGNRVARGGGFGSVNLIGFRADQRSVYPPDLENVALGFRVAQLIPISPGDLNGDGSVDAADYVVWRKTGINSPTGYDTWRTHFGEPAAGGSGTSVNATVPEPATITLSLFALAASASGAVGRRRTFRQLIYV